jgi:oligopeptide/dipeptide ABC transporter ATP-binding protein
MTALAIAQLVPYPGRTSGEVLLHGRDLGAERRARTDRLLGTDVAFVFQDPTASLNPALSIGLQLTEAVEVHRGVRRTAARKLAADKLREVHIPAPAQQLRRFPHEFSGGMRQRAMIAMGLMGNPSLLICDEPTTALDVTIQAQIMELLAEINRTHDTAIVLISHNLALVAQNCDRIVVMYAGRIVEELTREQLLEDPQHPYTRALLGAVPDVQRARDDELTYIPGETPDPAAIPSGCPFHPRCPLRVERCADERPPLVVRDDGRRIACWVATGATG